MKTISPALKAHLQGEVTTIATCWKATLTNNQVYGFTDHTEDITFDSVTFEASTGFTPSNIQATNDLAVDNLEVHGLLSSDAISEADIMAGLWDYATVEVFIVNWADLTQGALYLRKGELGNVKINRSSFIAEMRGMMQRLTNNLGEITTPTCRAIFCDARCGLNAVTYTVSGTITSVSSNRIIADSSRTEADHYFTYGMITFTSGDNIGLSMEIKNYVLTGGSIEMVLPLPYAIAVGDTYTMIAGCNKTITKCVSFSNAVNFRGEPHVPGVDKLFQYGTN